MDTFKQLLLIYASKLKSNQLFLDDIVVIINETLGLNLLKEDLKLVNGELRLRLKSKEKLLLILYKDILLEKFKSSGIKIIDLK